MNINGSQITEIKVKGFKSIREAEIDLGMLNVLIGANGAGKSNFISLFKLLHEWMNDRLESCVAKQGGMERILYMGGKVTPRFDVRLDIGGSYHSVSFIPSDDGRIATVEGTPPRHEKQICWSVYHFHDTGETAHMKKMCGLNDNISLASDGRNLAAYLYRLFMKEQPSYQRIVKTIQLAAPFFNDFFLRPNPLNEEMIQLEWTRTNSDIPFLASQLSDGTLRFICLATLLLQPKHLAPDTIIIDEPELGLHPHAITLLGEMIKSASVDKQIILSTQSVDLLNEFDLENVIVVDHIDNASSFRRLSFDELKHWLEDGYSLGTLWCKNLFGGRSAR